MVTSERRLTRTPTGTYWTGSMTLPTAVGKIDLGLLARALLAGIKATPLGDGAYAVTSSNRFERGPYRVQLNGETATCKCQAGSVGAPCKHVAVARIHAAIFEETAQ